MGLNPYTLGGQNSMGNREWDGYATEQQYQTANQNNGNIIMNAALNAFNTITSPKSDIVTKAITKTTTYTPSYKVFAQSSAKAQTDNFASDLAFSHLCREDSEWPYNCNQYHSNLAKNYSKSYSPYTGAYSSYAKANTVTTTKTEYQNKLVTTPYQFQFGHILTGLGMFLNNVDNQRPHLMKNQGVINEYEAEQWAKFNKQQEEYVKANTCTNVFQESRLCTAQQLAIREICKGDWGCQLYQITGKDIDEHTLYAMSSTTGLVTFSIKQDACKTSQEGLRNMGQSMANSFIQDNALTQSYAESCANGDIQACNKYFEQKDYLGRAARSIATSTVNTVSTCGSAMYNGAFGGQLTTNQEAFACADTAGIVYGAKVGLSGVGGVTTREMSASIYNFNAPASRHYIKNITQNSYVKNVNTVILNNIDVANDMKMINSGNAVRMGDTFTINNRVYGMHDGTLYPISGDGFITLDRGAYKTLGIYNKFGNTPEANLILDNMQINQTTRSTALQVYNQ